MHNVSRRVLLQSVGALLPAAAVSHSVNVVVAGGHPGDPEYGCGGTIARYAQAGHSVTLLYLNRGDKGCPNKSGQECSGIRSAESTRACKILGAKPAFAGQTDGAAVVDAANYDSFRDLLAGLHPDVVFTHWPIDNHRDHRAITMLVYDAWVRMHKQFALYYYEVSDGEDTLMFKPSAYVDVTSTERLKYEACFAHASQTPARYFALQLEVMRFRGVESGFQFAEAFAQQVESPAGLLP